MEHAAIHILGTRADLDGLPVIQPRDDLSLDPIPIVQLFAAKGEDAAEEVICRALENLARRLQQVDLCHRTCDFAQLAKTAGAMRGVARQIGMNGVSQVADMVCDCVASGDSVALGATVARLNRVVDRSLTEIWDLSALS